MLLERSFQEVRLFRSRKRGGGEPSGLKKQDVGGHLARKGIAYLGSVGFMWRKQSAFGNMEQERVLNPKGLIY